MKYLVIRLVTGLVMLALLFLIIWALEAIGRQEPLAIPATYTATATSSPTGSPTLTHTPSPTAPPTDTATLTPTSTRTPVPSNTPSPTLALRPTPTETRPIPPILIVTYTSGPTMTGIPEMMPVTGGADGSLLLALLAGTALLAIGCLLLSTRRQGVD